MRRSKRRAAAPGKKRAARERLYTRYDPETGQKVRVTKDAFEYSEWPSRKPSKKKIQRAALKADPLGTTGQILQESGKRAVSRAVEQQASRAARGIARTAAPVSAAAAARVLALPALAAAGAIAAAGILGGWLLDQAGDVGRVPSLGERANQLSRNFVRAQQALMQKTGARSWLTVPEGPRGKLLADYKQALRELYRAGDRARFTAVRNF